MKLDRRHLALCLLSVSLIAFQLVLMQLLSISQWDHFAFLVISVALLGFGASGTLLALFRSFLMARRALLMPLLMLGSAVTMAAMTAVIRSPVAGFDSYLLFFSPLQAGRLLAVILLLTIPFLLGALAIGMLFVEDTAGIGALYFANLAGSGTGGLLGLSLLALLPPAQLPVLVALPALLAGCLLARRAKGRLLPAAAVAAAAALLALLLHPPQPALSPYKDLKRTLDLPGSRIVASGNSPLGQVTAVAADALRFGPGLSLTYEGAVPDGDALFLNGNWFGFVPADPPLAATMLDATTGGLPYAMGSYRKVLLLQAGTGLPAAQALSHGTGQIVAVEPHSAALSLLRRHYRQGFATTLGDARVTLQQLEPRSFLAGDDDSYDLIILPHVGAFGGGAGLFAVQQQPLLTVEAFAGMWRRLSPRGRLSVTVWMQYPPRASLRLAATLAAALRSEGVERPLDHVATVRSWGTLTFCVSRTPTSAAEIEQVRAFADQMLFDPALLPGLKEEELYRHNRLADPAFFEQLESSFSGRPPPGYPFRLQPPSDNRPFFSQFLKIDSLPQLQDLYGQGGVPYLELGYLIVLLTLLLASASAFILILLPLFRLGFRRQGRWQVLAYFGGLGVGYMMFEMALFHRFALFLGHPVYALALVISSLLLFSGAGSYLSARLGAGSGRRIALLVASLIGLYLLLLPYPLQAAASLPLVARCGLTLLLLAPPAFVMGFPFPLGLRLLDQRRRQDVPWAWGINGCLSVVATPLATLVAVEAGFTAVFVFAAAAYLVCALSRLRPT